MKPDFLYTVYIRATREEVWNGLLEPEFTRQYWLHDNISDWEVGSKWEHKRCDGSEKVDVAGEVLESEKHTRLVVSWHRPEDAGNPDRTSRVAYQLADEAWPGGPWTRLTLEHTEFGNDDKMRTDVSAGWPMVFSGLKTLLEAGFRAPMEWPECST